MNIKRWGAYRDRGTTTIIPDLSLQSGNAQSYFDNISWNTKGKQINIRTQERHTDGRTLHNYVITLSLEDIATLLAIVGHAGSATDASLLRDHLKKHISALVKLLVCATGRIPTTMVEKKASSAKNHMKKHIPALVNLLACATGLIPKTMPEEKAPSAKGS